MANHPGPYIMEFGYRVSSLLHKLRFNVSAVGNPTPADSVSGIMLNTRGGSTRGAVVASNDIWEQYRIQYNTAVVCEYVTLYKVDPFPSLGMTFIATWAVTNPAGLSGSATVLAHQQVNTFRSFNGGIMKFSYLESILSGVVGAVTTLTANPAGSSAQRLASLFISNNGVVMSRDDAFIASPLKQLNGQNESIFRRRYRQL